MKLMNRAFKFFFLLAVTVSGDLYGQDSLETTFGQGLPVYAADSSFYLKFSTRFQNKYQARGPIKENVEREEINSSFLVRRARLKFSGYAYHPDLRFKIELGQSTSDLDKINPHLNNAPNLILDAVMKWDIRDNLSLWAGQTKLPGNRERVISSQELQFVDRSRVNANFNIDRDMGFQLHHHFELGPVLIRDIISVSQGEGRNVVDGAHGGYDYTGRVEVLPFGAFTNGGDYVSSDIFREEDPKLSLGASFDHNRNAIREEGNTGEFLPYDRDLTSLHLDMMFKYQGFSFMSEFAQREADNPVLYDPSSGFPGRFPRRVGSFYTGYGFVAQAGYLFKSDFEIAARYTRIRPENVTARPDVDEYTLGFSRYIVHHHLKVQSDLSYIEKSTLGDPHLRFRLQTEVSF